jgi:hypothetical protein
LVTKSYNGDLAEADQSHHEEAVGGIPELEVESSVAMSVAQGVSCEVLSTHAEGAATTDTSTVNNTTGAAEVKHNLT